MGSEVLTDAHAIPGVNAHTLLAQGLQVSSSVHTDSSSRHHDQSGAMERFQRRAVRNVSYMDARFNPFAGDAPAHDLRSLSLSLFGKEVEEHLVLRRHRA